MVAVHSLWAYDDDVTWHYALAAGQSAATFAPLAGVGIAFMTTRRPVGPGERRATAASLAARAGVIGAVGLALGWTDASLATVILVYYAVLFVLAIPAVSSGCVTSPRAVECRDVRAEERVAVRPPARACGRTGGLPGWSSR